MTEVFAVFSSSSGGDADLTTNTDSVGHLELKMKQEQEGISFGLQYKSLHSVVIVVLGIMFKYSDLKFFLSISFKIQQAFIIVCSSLNKKELAVSYELKANRQNKLAKLVLLALSL